MYPFRKVLGVEISPALNAIAEKNIARLRPRFLCQDVQTATSNAAGYRFPDDATVVYFFTPFGREIFAKVFAEIARSLQKNPRKLSVVYYKTETAHDIDRIVDCPWLSLAAYEVMPTGRTGSVYTNNRWVGTAQTEDSQSPQKISPAPLYIAG
jgi:hypothetical protein